MSCRCPFRTGNATARLLYPDPEALLSVMARPARPLPPPLAPGVRGPSFIEGRASPEHPWVTVLAFPCPLWLLTWPAKRRAHRGSEPRGALGCAAVATTAV